MDREPKTRIPCMWGGSFGFYKEASGKSERESVGHSVAFNSL